MGWFGTSGWRGVVGSEVTFRKVRRVTQAIVDCLCQDLGPGCEVLISYDTRMLSEQFAATAAKLIAANGVPVSLPPRDTPSPVLSSAILDRQAVFGITFTASHNPPEYNGLKLYTQDGILAPTEITDAIETRLEEIAGDDDELRLPQPQLIGSYDPRPTYLDRLQRLIDWDAIRSSGISLAVDPLFGTTRDYLDYILLQNEVPIVVLHNTRDPYFGGHAPDCSSANLSRLREVLRRTGAAVGLAVDGDGDRFGLLGHGARLKQPNLGLALILDYLARRRGLTGGVGRTLATSRLLDAVAAEHGLEVIETPVGFKSFGPLLVDGTLEFAGEESAGLAWSKHLPERDGVLACLLAAEMVAVEGMHLQDLVQRLFDRVGTWICRRIQVPLTDRVESTLETLREQRWTELGGRTVESCDRRDGLKLVFEGGSWILLRRSGTEPKVRLYAEGRSQEELRHLMHLARQLISTTTRRL